LRHDDLLHDIYEGRMRGIPTGGRRIQMLHDVVKDDSYIALKRADEDRRGWRHREKMSKTALQQKTTDDDDDDEKAS